MQKVTKSEYQLLTEAAQKLESLAEREEDPSLSNLAQKLYTVVDVLERRQRVLEILSMDDPADIRREIDTLLSRL